MSAERFEITWPAQSANFENGMGTGLNILFRVRVRVRVFTKVL